MGTCSDELFSPAANLLGKVQTFRGSSGETTNIPRDSIWIYNQATKEKHGKQKGCNIIFYNSHSILMARYASDVVTAESQELKDTLRKQTDTAVADVNESSE